MGNKRKKILVGLFVAMVLGIAVYFKLWSIDYAISSDDTELLRRQFDLANREALDESAEWRMKYDEETERAAKCDKELIEFKQKVEDAASVNQQLVMLQKELKYNCRRYLNRMCKRRITMLRFQENMALVERMESLKKELNSAKLKCRSQRIN